MFATTPELKSTTSAGLVVRIDKVSITLATYDLDKTFLAGYILEGILLEFYKLATSTIQSHSRLQVDGLLSTLRNVRNDLLPIKKVYMIGLEV